MGGVWGTFCFSGCCGWHLARDGSSRGSGKPSFPMLRAKTAGFNRADSSIFQAEVVAVMDYDDGRGLSFFGAACIL